MEGQISILEYLAAQDINAIISAVDVIPIFVGKAFAAIVSNPFLCVLVAAGLIGLGVRVWLFARRAS